MQVAPALVRRARAVSVKRRANRDALESGVIEEPNIVGDSTDDDSDLAVLALHEVLELANRDRGLVRAALTQPLEDGRIELGVCAAGQELVELHQELEIDILTLGFRAVVLLDTTASLQSDTHGVQQKSPM